MADSLHSLLAVLAGQAPAPALLSYSGALEPQELNSLVDALRGSRFTGGLRLKGCDLGDGGAKALATALCDNRKLQDLELPGNCIGRDGAAELCRMLDTNRSITDLDLEDNPCAMEAPDVMDGIHASVQRNRNLSSGPSSHETTPRPTDFRSHQTRMRIVEVSPDTPAGVVSPTGPSANVTAAKSLAFPSHPSETDRASTTTEFEVECRHLEERQAALESAVEQLEYQADEAEKWKRQMDVASDRAASLLGDHDQAIKQVRKNLNELEDWRGQNDQIINNFTVMVQRQNGEFQALKDKVLKLDNQADRSARRYLGVSEGGTPSRPSTPTAFPSPQTTSGAVDAELREQLRQLRDKQAALTEVHQQLSGLAAHQAAVQTRQGKEVSALQQHFQILEASHADTSRLEEQLHALEQRAAATTAQTEASSAALAEVQGQLETLGGTRGAVAGLQSRVLQVEAWEEDLQELREGLGVLPAQSRSIAELQSQSMDLQRAMGEITQVQRQILELQERSGDLPELRRQIQALEASTISAQDTRALVADISAMQAGIRAIASLQQQLTRFDSTEDSLKVLRQQVGALQTRSAAIPELQQQARGLEGITAAIRVIQGYISDLQTQSAAIPDLKAQIGVLGAKWEGVEDLQAHVEQLQAAIPTLRGSADRLDAISTSVRELQEHVLALQGSSAAIPELQGRLQECESMSPALGSITTGISTLHSDVAELKAKIEGLPELQARVLSLTAAAGCLDGLQQDIGTLRTQTEAIPELQADISRLSASYESLSCLRPKLDQLQKGIQLLNDDVSKLQDVHTSINRLHEQVSALHAASLAIPQLRQQVQALEAINASVAELQHHTSGLQQLCSAIPELQEHVAACQASCANLDALQEKAGALDGVESTISELSVHVAQLCASSQAIPDLQAQCAGLQAAGTAVTQLQQRVDVLAARTGTFEAWKAHTKSLQQSVSQMASTIADLQQELRSLGDAAVPMRKIQQELNERLGPLQEALTALQEHLGAVSAVVEGSDDLSQRINGLESAAAPARQLVDECKRQLADLQDAAESIVGVQMSLQQSVAPLAEQLPILAAHICQLQQAVQGHRSAAVMAAPAYTEAAGSGDTEGITVTIATAFDQPVSHPLADIKKDGWYSEEETSDEQLRIAALESTVSQQQICIARLQDDVTALKAGVKPHSGGQENDSGLSESRPNTAHKTPREFESPQVTSALVPLRH